MQNGTAVSGVGYQLIRLQYLFPATGICRPESCNSWLSAYTLILDVDAKGTHLPGSSRRRIIMARECSITGAKPAKGHIIHRRGMAKKKGGVGRHVTANTPRLFLPNLQTKRIWVAELNRFVTVKLTARALKTITKNGAFQTLKKAGLV